MYLYPHTDHEHIRVRPCESACMLHLAIAQYDFTEPIPDKPDFAGINNAYQDGVKEFKWVLNCKKPAPAALGTEYRSEVAG